MDIGTRKEIPLSFPSDWAIREIGFNQLPDGTLVIASLPSGKRVDLLMGGRCEIYLYPDGTYWGSVDTHFVGTARKSATTRPRIPPTPENGCRFHTDCGTCPEADCIL